jgi:Arc/MetJ-type ribon-helix-helix transcriptional regulator
MSRSEVAEVWDALAEHVARHGDFPEGCSISDAVRSVVRELAAATEALRAAERAGDETQRPDPDALEEWTPEELAEMRADFEAFKARKEQRS